MSISEKIKAIKLAAASEYGKEVEIFVDGKRVNTTVNCCWQLRQIAVAMGGCCWLLRQSDDLSDIRSKDRDDSPFYRLDVQRGDINSHSIFNLMKDITKEGITRQFKAMDVSYEEYMKEHAGV